MVSNRLMWIAIFVSIFSHPCTVADVLADVIPGVGVDTDVALDADLLSDMGAIVMDSPAITLDVVVVVACAVDLLSGLLTVLIIGVVSAIDADMFDDEDVNGLVAVMTPLEFTLSAPWEEPTPVC